MAIGVYRDAILLKSDEDDIVSGVQDVMHVLGVCRSVLQLDVGGD